MKSDVLLDDEGMALRSEIERLRQQLSAVAETSHGEVLGKEITRRQIAEEQLRILGSAIQNAGEGIIIVTPPTPRAPRIVYANQGLTDLTGVAVDDATGKTLKILPVLRQDRAVIQQLIDAMKDGRPFKGEVTATRSEIEWAMELQASPVTDADTGKLTHFVVILRDVTERREQIAALRHLALHDTLTGLPNRALLADRLDVAILHARRENNHVAFLLMDLDRFKEINETFGHQLGDRILCEVGSRLEQQIRVTDTVARIGGDEFAVVLTSLSRPDDATRIAMKILHCLERPVDIDGQAFDVAGSIGIALYPTHGDDGQALHRRADIAMYQAKASASGYSFYDAEQDAHRPTHFSLMLELRKAIDQNQLELHYQPKAHLQSGLVTRVEALVRWRHPEHGMISPAHFIPIAERTGLVKPLTDWVLDVALHQCADWNRDGMPMSVSVNLSARTLQESFLPELVTEMLGRWDVEPRSLKLEITESSLLSDPARIISMLTDLQALGVGFSLDDFGTGYSSLSHLRKLPVDEIKIDKSFVRDMTSNEHDAAIVRATIELAHNLGRQVVAEGVEDQATWEMLKKLGCDLVQGYYVSPPLPAMQLNQWLLDSRWGLDISR